MTMLASERLGLYSIDPFQINQYIYIKTLVAWFLQEINSSHASTGSPEDCEEYSSWKKTCINCIVGK